MFDETKLLANFHDADIPRKIEKNYMHTYKKITSVEK